MWSHRSRAFSRAKLGNRFAHPCDLPTPVPHQIPPCPGGPQLPSLLFSLHTTSHLPTFVTHPLILLSVVFPTRTETSKGEDWMAQVVKNPPANAGDSGLIPGLGRSPGEGNGNPLQYSCLGDPMDRGAWRGLGSQSWTQLSGWSYNNTEGWGFRLVRLSVSRPRTGWSPSGSAQEPPRSFHKVPESSPCAVLHLVL